MARAPVAVAARANRAPAGGGARHRRAGARRGGARRGGDREACDPAGRHQAAPDRGARRRQAAGARTGARIRSGRAARRTDASVLPRVPYRDLIQDACRNRTVRPLPQCRPFGTTGTKWSRFGAQRYDHAALPTGMPRRLFFVALGAVVLGILIAAPSALADAFTPESGGSQNANDIDTLYKITFYIGIVIFLLVWGVLIWSLVKYRARRDGRADQIRGNTPLEVGWTIGAAGILVILTVVTFLYLDDIDNPPGSA